MFCLLGVGLIGLRLQVEEPVHVQHRIVGVEGDWRQTVLCLLVLRLLQLVLELLDLNALDLQQLVQVGRDLLGGTFEVVSEAVLVVDEVFVEADGFLGTQPVRQQIIVVLE